MRRRYIEDKMKVTKCRDRRGLEKKVKGQESRKIKMVNLLLYSRSL